MASQSDNLEKFLKCLSLYPVAKTILKNITSMETMRALLQLAKETFSGPDQDTIKRLFLKQGSNLIRYYVHFHNCYLMVVSLHTHHYSTYQSFKYSCVFSPPKTFLLPPLSASICSKMLEACSWWLRMSQSLSISHLWKHWSQSAKWPRRWTSRALIKVHLLEV